MDTFALSLSTETPHVRSNLAPHAPIEQRQVSARATAVLICRVPTSGRTEGSCADGVTITTGRTGRATELIPKRSKTRPRLPALLRYARGDRCDHLRCFLERRIPIRDAVATGNVGEI